MGYADLGPGDPRKRAVPLRLSSSATEHRTGTKGALGAQKGEPES